MKSKKIIHPLLFSLYPILALIEVNLNQISFDDVIRSLLLSFLSGGCIWLLSRVILKDPNRAAILATTLIAILFSSGHIHNLLGDYHIFALRIGRIRYIFLMGALIFVLVFWSTFRYRSHLAQINSSLNVIAIILFAIPLLQIPLGISSRQQAPVSQDRLSIGRIDTDITSMLSGHEAKSDLPDIYYIIPDMYTSEGVMWERFNFDNSVFIEWLEEGGFYVAGCSQSNYQRTVWSLASTLNMSYLDVLDEHLVATSKDPYAFMPYVKDNVVRQILEDIGYSIVAVETGFAVTEWTDADIYKPFSSAGAQLLFAGLNSFETIFLRTTAGFPLLDSANHLPNNWRISFIDSAYINHRGRIVFAFDELKSISAMVKGPKFVFVHILAPHPPFVFGPNGEYVERTTPFTLDNDEEYYAWDKFSEGYVDQLKYINQRLKDVILEITASSKSEPIIILQGDHGVPRLTENLENTAILNALKIPNAEEYFYPTVTPVNTFRIVFSTIFQIDLPLLQDSSMLSKSRNDPFNFQVFPSWMTPCETD
jgi:hypothetical protein